MTSLPISSDAYMPSLLNIEKRQLNWMGRFVEWIHDSKKKGWLYHSVVSASMIIFSTILVCSVVFSPFFIFGFKEFIIQKERARYDAHFEKLSVNARDHAQYFFNRGRIDPLESLSHLYLKPSTLEDIREDLPPSSKSKSDLELLKEIATRCHNFLEHYDLQIKSN